MNKLFAFKTRDGKSSECSFMEHKAQETLLPPLVKVHKMRLYMQTEDEKVLSGI